MDHGVFSVASHDHLLLAKLLGNLEKKKAIQHQVNDTSIITSSAKISIECYCWEGLPSLTIQAGEADMKLTLSASACHTGGPNSVNHGQILLSYSTYYFHRHQHQPNDGSFVSLDLVFDPRATTRYVKWSVYTACTSQLTLSLASNGATLTATLRVQVHDTYLYLSFLSLSVVFRVALNLSGLISSFWFWLSSGFKI